MRYLSLVALLLAPSVRTNLSEIAKMSDDDKLAIGTRARRLRDRRGRPSQFET